MVAGLRWPTALVVYRCGPEGLLAAIERRYASWPEGECGHWPQHEHADRFNALHMDFLNGGQA
ncbi:hypothetical protein KN815_23995 [Streptomyces sp. 4503]|uniref:Uncharacterized protein n=1 Tax=Streptomyces niphimycinicus TaxID=2842201 RepID=A0ABS6CJ89_9ACTN|nr:hypothetical protein [Streptomyces niphimycinicus]MBU3867011.1 hypothetical protein [Streptomyces niphimycinicus]